MNRGKFTAFFMIMLFMGLIMASCGEKGVSNPDAEKMAIPAAEAWLKHLDSKEYDKCWGTFSTVFRSKISKDDLTKQLKLALDPMGKMKSRTIQSKMYHTKLPGAPDGEYLVIQYKTSFEKKESAIETITPTKDKDGVWRVSGYYIK